MALAAGYHDVPPGKIAVAVNSLEMLAKPPERAARGGAGDFGTSPIIRRVAEPDLGWYRDLFRRIGSDWLWFSRLRLDDAGLAAIITHPAVAIWALQHEGRDEGLLELDFRVPGECELAFFGLTRRMIGSGAGRRLMSYAIAEAWARPIRRFWVHTCTGDHPSALAFYVRSGFVPYRMQVEIADDPRLDGSLPATAAPHVPLIRPSSQDTAAGGSRSGVRDS
jgi:GNAT superfamily N-acetyltransferase